MNQYVSNLCGGILCVCVCRSTISMLQQVFHNSALAISSCLHRALRPTRLRPSQICLGLVHRLTYACGLPPSRNLSELSKHPMNIKFFNFHLRFFLPLISRVALPQAAAILNNCHWLLLQMPWVGLFKNRGSSNPIK